MTYDNTNRGFIRKNDKKNSDRSPDYRGEINVNGETFWLSGWLSEHERMGGKYFQLSVQSKDKEFEKAKNTISQPDSLSDEIPF